MEGEERKWPISPKKDAQHPWSSGKCKSKPQRHHFVPTWMARIKYTIPSVGKEAGLFGELSPNKFCSWLCNRPSCGRRSDEFTLLIRRGKYHENKAQSNIFIKSPQIWHILTVLSASGFPCSYLSCMPLNKTKQNSMWSYSVKILMAAHGRQDSPNALPWHSSPSTSNSNSLCISMLVTYCMDVSNSFIGM